jgi:hypothetical protein
MIVSLKGIFDNLTRDYVKQENTLFRVMQARMKYIRETGKVPKRVFLGREQYLAVRGSMKSNMASLYGMEIYVLPIEDACCCAAGTNDEEALRP